MTFRGESVEIPEALAERMRMFTWRESLPGGFVGPRFDELRLLRVSHWDFTGAEQTGELVVASHVAADVLSVFEELYQAAFPIEQLRLIDAYEGNDERSMLDNNSSGYNCRLIAGTTQASKHASGLAIDINPVQNPYIVAGAIYPPNAGAFADRSHARPGMLFEDGPVVRGFARIGWQWGGHWHEPRDYHHFEAVTR